MKSMRHQHGGNLKSDRLLYTPLTPDQEPGFLRLLRDDHIRRYLLDGQIVSATWCQQRILDSERWFAERGIGIWLVHEAITKELVGFCGFLQSIPDQPEPQLVYALLEGFTGRGYATEMAQRAIAAAFAAHITTIYASVDACNVASVRVLERLAFEKQSTSSGAFGPMLLLALTSPSVVKPSSFNHT